MSDASAPSMERIEFLAERHARGELSPGDIAELSALCQDPASARSFIEALADRHDWRRWAGHAAPNENFARIVLERHAHGPASSRFLHAVTSVAETEISCEIAPKSVARAWTARKHGAARSQAFAWIAASVLLVAGILALNHSQKTAPISIATLSQVRGATVLRNGNDVSASVGMPLFSGDEIRVAAGGATTISYPDETRVEIAAGASVVLDAPASSVKSRGKSILVASGKVSASVSPQPAERPMVFAAAQAEATVLGTELVFSALEKSARLDVIKGRVQLKRLDDGASVDVTSGNFAVAARDVALLAQPIAPLAPPEEPGVFYVAEKGNDSQSGSQANPCREIFAAMERLKPGYNVLVGDGWYRGFEIENLRGTAEKPITIKALGRGARIFPSKSQGDTLVVRNSRYLVLDGFQISDAVRNGINMHSSQFITIRNCSVNGSQLNGIASGFCDDLRIEQNTSFGNKSSGISVSNSSHRPLVRGNTLYDNIQSGIFMNGDRNLREENGAPSDGLVSGALIENNILHANNVSVGAAINLDGVQDSVLRNNLLYANHSTGIALYRTDGAAGPKGIRIFHNTIDMADDSRYAIEIHNSAGTNLIRNNIFVSRNAKQGAFAFGNARDIKLTDSDCNLFGGATQITPDNGNSRIALELWQAQGRDLHSIITSADEPIFVRPGADFHLKENAPARAKGESLPDADSDIEGHPRALERRPDLGAYQN